MKRVEPVHDLSHQVAHFLVTDTRDVCPRDVLSIGVDDGHVAPVAGLCFRRLACMEGLKVRIAHAQHRHGLGEFSRDTLFGFIVHWHRLMPSVSSCHRSQDVLGSKIRLDADPRTIVGGGGRAGLHEQPRRQELRGRWQVGDDFLLEHRAGNLVDDAHPDG